MLKWIASILSLGLLALWCLSYRYEVYAESLGATTSVRDGRCWVGRSECCEQIGYGGAHVGVYDQKYLGWWIGDLFTRRLSRSYGVTFPLGMVALALGVVAGMAGWVDRRRSRSAERCWKCGYDRRGIGAEAKCPECGTATR